MLLTYVYSPESLGKTSTLQASLVVSDIVEPQGSKRTGPGAGKHSKLPSMFSTIAPEQTMQQENKGVCV